MKIDEYDAGSMDKPETEPESVTSAGIGRPYGSAGMVSRTVERSARIASRSVSRAKRKATGVAVPPSWQFPQGSRLCFGNMSVSEICTIQDNTKLKLTFAQLWFGYRCMVTRTTTPRTGDIKVPGPTCESHGRTYELFGTKLQDGCAGFGSA